jgi:hypothetical protein
MFPVSCADAPPRSNRNAPAHSELLSRSWNFSVVVVNIILHITKKLLKCRAVVRSCKNFLLRAVAGPRSCKKKNQNERCRGGILDVLALSLAKARYNAEAILKDCELFVYGDIDYITNSFCKSVLKIATCWPMYWIAFFIIFRIIISSLYLYGMWYIEKCEGQIMYILIHSLSCVLNFMLAVCRTNRLAWSLPLPRRSRRANGFIAYRQIFCQNVWLLQTSLHTAEPKDDH